jgi:hemerythrin-like metal-binding protein
MPTRLPWDPHFDVGHELIDAQHRAMLDQCNRLADLCGGGGDADRQFDQAFEQLRALTRAHFETEATLLAERDHPDLDDPAAECEEFDYLVDEIVTTDNFDRLELQRFLALWCLGHISGATKLAVPA